ncbi:unnamed protein product [Urochloa humidicola]
MPRDGAGRGLEVDAVLAAEAAWELREPVASMAGTRSLDMDVDSPQLLTVDAGGDVSILAPDPSTLNKVPSEFYLLFSCGFHSIPCLLVDS